MGKLRLLNSITTIMSESLKLGFNFHLNYTRTGMSLELTIDKENVVKTDIFIFNLGKIKIHSDNPSNLTITQLSFITTIAEMVKEENSILLDETNDLKEESDK